MQRSQKRPRNPRSILRSLKKSNNYIWKITVRSMYAHNGRIYKPVREAVLYNYFSIIIITVSLYLRRWLLYANVSMYMGILPRIPRLNFCGSKAATLVNDAESKLPDGMRRSKGLRIVKRGFLMWNSGTRHKHFMLNRLGKKRKTKTETWWDHSTIFLYLVFERGIYLETIFAFLEKMDPASNII